MLCRSHDGQRAGSFLKQRISMPLQIGNAARVLGTVSDRDAFEEIYYMKPNFFVLYIIAALNNHQTTHTSHYPSRPVDTFLKRAAMIYRCKKAVR